MVQRLSCWMANSSVKSGLTVLNKNLALVDPLMRRTRGSLRVVDPWDPFEENGMLTTLLHEDHNDFMEMR